MSVNPLFLIAIQVIISSCVIAIFMSIFVDFALFSRKTHVQKEKKSIVETGTMTLFFLLDLVILKSGIGRVEIHSSGILYGVMVFGASLILLGCFVNLLGRFCLGNNWANHIKIYEEHQLVVRGPYKFVRHPLYASIIMMLYGAVFIFRSITSLVAISLIFVPFMIYRSHQEEDLLVARFTQYKSYKEKTGMLLPKIRTKGGRRDERNETR